MIQDTFEMMKSIVETPGFRFLKEYKRDFYTYDKEYLYNTMTPHARYLWVVREMGSHLIRLKVHPKMCEEGCAVLNADRDVQCYIVMPRLVRPVTREAAMQELATMSYAVLRDGELTHVRKGMRHLATARFTCHRPPCKPREWAADLSVGISGAAGLDDDDIVAIRQILECDVISREQSLFVRMPKISVHGEDLIEIIERRLKKYRSATLAEAA